jgi:ergothioneine biosynthesis protein EgtB
MPDVSPTKWHLAHTSWFFETFLLRRDASYESPRDEYQVLFNSYYNTVGEQHPRPRRGMLSRPTLAQVYDYRHAIDRGIKRFIESASDDELEECRGILEVGLHHEQQHQELMMTDILHVYWTNPLRPAYRESPMPTTHTAPAISWERFDEGVVWIGADVHDEGFAFDNEYPRHRAFVHPFELASRTVTASEYMEFVSDGGYQRPELWLSDGWAVVNEERWQAPLYWERRHGTWWRMTFHGMQPVDPNAPVCHVSYFEADAYARWKGARLPTEVEWEVAAAGLPIEGNLLESEELAPLGTSSSGGGVAKQMFGDVWEWTASAYLPYPGYKASPGALGEYNGKFMCNQMVLRGGSFVTSVDHIRPTYRNFFYPHCRWQFMGFRLARDVA